MNLSFADFKLHHQLSESKVWDWFYQLHHAKLEVKNPAIAKQKLKRIMQATFKLSHDKGFALMTLRDLARQSDLSLGGIYSYIGSKEQLALMIHQFLPFVFSKTLTRHPEQPLSQSNLAKENCVAERARVALITFICEHLYLSEWLTPWFFFAFMEAKYSSPKIRKVALENESTTQQVLFERVANVSIASHHELSQQSALLVAMNIKSLLQSWYLKRPIYHKQKVTVDDYANHLAQLINRGIIDGNGQSK